MSKNNYKDVRESKRAKFFKPAKQRELPISTSVLAIAGIVILTGAAILLWRGPGTSGQVTQLDSSVQVAQPIQPTDNVQSAPADTDAQDDIVRLPLATFDDGHAHYYSHQAGDTMIEYFVLKSSDGVVRAAFDACDVCFEARKGYRQEGDEMVCNNCGMRFPSVLINERQGGCNPAPLDRTIEGNELVIRVDDIFTGIGYFD